STIGQPPNRPLLFCTHPTRFGGSFDSRKGKAMHIHCLINPTGTDFVRAKGKVVFAEQAHSPNKDPRGYWGEAIRTDDNTSHQPHHPNVVRREPVFSIQGGRVYATFPLVKK